MKQLEKNTFCRSECKKKTGVAEKVVKNGGYSTIWKCIGESNGGAIPLPASCDPNIYMNS